MKVVITGANRGIGLGLAARYLSRGETVFAGARVVSEARALRELGAGGKGTLVVVGCDVSSDAGVEALIDAVAGDTVDVLINNAGVMGEHQGVAEVDLGDVAKTMEVNALGALRVTRALIGAIKRGREKKIVHVSSGMGSIGDNTSGGWYGYRMSKAALNMASRCLAIELKPEGVVSVVINPGWVQTDMGGRAARVTVEESCEKIVNVIDALTLDDSGEFLDYKGGRWVW